MLELGLIWRSILEVNFVLVLNFGSSAEFSYKENWPQTQQRNCCFISAQFFELSLWSSLCTLYDNLLQLMIGYICCGVDGEVILGWSNIFLTYLETGGAWEGRQERRCMGMLLRPRLSRGWGHSSTSHSKAKHYVQGLSQKLTAKSKLTSARLKNARELSDGNLDFRYENWH